VTRSGCRSSTVAGGLFLLTRLLQVQPQAGVAVDGGVDVVVSSLWESIPCWEAWSKSDLARQHHMPTGESHILPAP